MTKQSDFHDFSLQAREDNSECTNAMTCGPKQRIDSAHTDSLHHLALWQTFPFYNLTVDCFSTSVHVGKLKLLLGFILTACKLHIVCFGRGNHSILDHTICVMLVYYCRHSRWGFEKSAFRILFCRTFPACSLARFTVAFFFSRVDRIPYSTNNWWCLRIWLWFQYKTFNSIPCMDELLLCGKTISIIRFANRPIIYFFFQRDSPTTGTIFSWILSRF